MKYFFRLLVPVLILTIAVQAGAQEKKVSVLEQRKTELEQEKERRRNLRQRTPYEQLKAVLEGPVEPETYVLGPGDVLILGIWGSIMEDNILIDVLPEAVINVPGVGALPVKNMTLKEAQDIVRSKLSEIYRNSNISLTLAQVRTFRVYITGEVDLPGEYIANATTRVSSIINEAWGPNEWADGHAVRIHHSSGETDIFDYWGYLYEGAYESNIRVSDGDVIYVPNRNASQGTVMLRTGNDVVGYYPCGGETGIREFLEISGLINALFDWEQINVIRLLPDGGTRVNRVTLSENENSTPFRLRPGDTIIVPTLTQYVYVQGEVTTPGEILWEPNRRASYYVGIAGKTTNAYKDNKIELIRGDAKIVSDESDPVIFPGDIISVPKRKFLVFREYLDFIAPITSIIIAAKAVGVIK